MRYFLLPIVWLFLNSCTATPIPATQEEKDLVISRYIKCLNNAASQLDDYTSDPVSIAYAITPICYSDLVVAAKVFAKGLNPQAERMAQDYMLRDQTVQIERATIVVIEHRKQAHKK